MINTIIMCSVIAAGGEGFEKGQFSSLAIKATVTEEHARH
jgi:hypothetical protein